MLGRRAFDLPDFVVDVGELPRGVTGEPVPAVVVAKGFQVCGSLRPLLQAEGVLGEGLAAEPEARRHVAEPRIKTTPSSQLFIY